MVHLFDRCDPSFLEAALAQWVRRYIPGAYSMPCPPVLTVRVRCTLVPVVLFSCFLPVQLAVQAVRKVRASGISAWSFRFPWHITTFLKQSAYEKAHAVFPAQALSVLSLYYNYSIGPLYGLLRFATVCYGI